jgi:hypothetical protein
MPLAEQRETAVGLALDQIAQRLMQSLESRGNIQ